MGERAAMTVLRSRQDVERLWDQPDLRSGSLGASGARAWFVDAPGDRGTEIHVEADVPMAKIKDELRRFKQLAETGEIARSDGVPEGELAERKLKQRPAQPLDAGELEKAGVS
jgi:hypothetical protein